MGWPVCNTTLEDLRVTEQPVWHNYTYHLIGLWLSAIFGLIAVVVSLVLIFLHCTHYLKPYEQKHIIRILFMVPVYATVSFLSFVYYRHSVYFEVLRDCYEAFAIASFFSLLCAYIEPDLHGQKEYFRTIQPRRWIWPMNWLQKCWGGEKGIWRTPRSGLTWFNVIWVAIFQYCFIRVFMTCVAVITQVFSRYCLESLNPAFAHVWVMVIEAMAVTIAMYCLIQFYIQIRGDIRQHKPLLKVAAIKLVIFLSFWQTLIISFLTSTGVMKASPQFQTPDIKVGIPAMLLCIEMAIFAIFHIWAFSWRPYSLSSKESQAEMVPGETTDRIAYQGGFLGIRAMMDAFNPWDLIKAVGRAAKWLFRDRKTRLQDVSYDLSRKTTAASEIPLGQHPTDQTAYTGAEMSPTKPTHYNGEGGEGETLLANTQSVPMSKPYTGHSSQPYTQPHTSEQYTSYDQPPERRYRPNEDDIGVATSTYDNRSGQGQSAGSASYSKSHAAEYHHEHQNQHYPTDNTGDVPVRGDGRDQVQMPYYSHPPRRDSIGKGNGNMF